MDENLVLNIIDTDAIARQVQVDLEWAARRYRFRNPQHFKEKEYTVKTEIIWVPAEWHGPLPPLVRAIITRALVKLVQQLSSEGIECDSIDWRDTVHSVMGNGLVRQLPWINFSKKVKNTVTRFVWSKQANSVMTEEQYVMPESPPQATPSSQTVSSPGHDVPVPERTPPHQERRAPIERIIEKDGRVLVLTCSGERVDRYVPPSRRNGRRSPSPPPRRRSPPRHRTRSRSRSPLRRRRTPPPSYHPRYRERSPPRRRRSPPPPPRNRSRTPVAYVPPPTRKSPSPELPRRLREPKTPSPDRTPPPPRRSLTPPRQHEERHEEPMQLVLTEEPAPQPQQHVEDDDLVSLGIEPGDYELLFAAN